MLICKHPPHTPPRIWLRHFNKKNFVSFFSLKNLPIRCRVWLVFLAELLTYYSMLLIDGVILWRVSLFYTPVTLVYARVSLFCAPFLFFVSLYIYLSYLIEKERNKGLINRDIQLFYMRGLRILTCTNLRGFLLSLAITRALTRAFFSYKKQMVRCEFSLIRQYAGKSAPTLFFWSNSWN